MPAMLDHITIPARDRVAAAKLLGEILGAESGQAPGPFTPLYVNDGLTFDFDQFDDGKFPVLHFAFRVADAELDGIVARLKKLGIPYRSSVRGPEDGTVGTYNGGRLVYW